MLILQDKDDLNVPKKDKTERDTADPRPLNGDVANTVPRMSSRLYSLQDLLRFQ